jgi:hypothetical protein
VFRTVGLSKLLLVVDVDETRVYVTSDGMVPGLGSDESIMEDEEFISSVSICVDDFDLGTFVCAISDASDVMVDFFDNFRV